jgi:hypothetical protein
MQGPLTKKLASLFLVCVLLSPMLPAKASGADQHTTITLDQAVHFIGTDGSDAVAEPGDYSVEAAQEWLRLIPGTERHDALLIEAQPGTHDVKVEIPIVISTPGTEPDETDVHVVQFLNPDGTSLVATGTYSGNQSRGLGAAARQAAARARTHAEAARQAAAAQTQQTADAARIAALKAKQAAEETAAQTSESADKLSVTIDRTAQFPSPKGEDVLVPAGTYAVTVENEQFTLTEGPRTPITLETTEWSHTAQIPSPTVVFLASEEGQIPQRHLLVLYYPDGKTIQAVGTDPVVASRGTQELPSEYVIDPALVTFEQSVHFTAPDGTPVVVHPGTYTAEAAEQAIRLIPSGDSPEALLIEARQGTHETPLEVLLALSLPGTTPKELDFNYLMLLLPTGRSLEATGSYSGIQTRGWFKKAFNTAKSGVSTGVNTVGNTAKQGVTIVEGVAKQGVSAASSAAIQAGKGIEQGAKLTWDGTKWVGAKIALCYSTVGAMKAGKAVTGVVGKIIPDAIAKKTQMITKLTNDLSFRGKVTKKIDQTLNTNRGTLSKVTEFYRNIPNVKAKLGNILSIDNFCKDSLSAMDAKLKRLGLVPNVARAQPQVAAQVQPQVQPQVTVAMVPGTYRHNPVQNNWHIGSIVPDGAGLRWTNKAGASWHLTPDLANQQLLAPGTDNPYSGQGLKEFKLIISNGQITGFQFGGGTYLRETAQTPTRTAIRSRGIEKDPDPWKCLWEDYKEGLPKFGYPEPAHDPCEDGSGPFLGYQLTFDVGAGIGGVAGILGVTDNKGHGGKYYFYGGQAGWILGAGGAAQVLICPINDVETFTGDGWSFGGSVQTPKGPTVNVDVSFVDELFSKVQCIAIGGGVGIGPTKKTVDAGVSYEKSIKY